jgi:hypothetical protein
VLLERLASSVLDDAPDDEEACAAATGGIGKLVRGCSVPRGVFALASFAFAGE